MPYSVGLPEFNKGNKGKGQYGKIKIMASHK